MLPPSSASSCRPEDGSSMFLTNARKNTTLHGVKLQKAILKSQNFVSDNFKMENAFDELQGTLFPKSTTEVLNSKQNL